MDASVIKTTLILDTSEAERRLNLIALRIAELIQQAQVLRGITVEIDSEVDAVIESLERVALD